jgi:zinc D-Ala-D-Ala carboxypeptidase
MVRSANRSPEHAGGGAAHSKHMEGAAFDIAMANRDPAAFEAAAREVGVLGFYLLPGTAQWGESFPTRPEAFASKTRRRARACRTAGR